MLDFAAVATAALPGLRALLGVWLPGGRFEGCEYIVCNPTRDDKTPGSFKINASSGAWADYASGDRGGDPISLYAYVNRISQGQACKQLAAQLGIETQGQGRTEWADQIIPAPADMPAVPREIRRYIDGNWSGAAITHSWEYRSATGDTLGHVVRYTTPTGKETVVLTAWNSNRGRLWRQKTFPEPRPLYNLDRLAHSPRAQIIIVEGEKCAQALQGLIDGSGWQDRLVSATWSGGCKACHKADLSPLRGRSCILWPDNDDSGVGAMHDVAGRLKGIGCAVKLLRVPGDRPKGWDCADAILDDNWTLDQIIAYIKENRIDSDAEPVQPVPSRLPVPQNRTDENPYGDVIMEFAGKMEVNQSAFADRFVRESGIIYDPAFGRFYVYNAITGIWDYQTNDATVRELGRMFQVVAREMNYPELVKKRTSNILSGLASLTRGLAEKRDVFTTRPTAIHVANGMLVMDDGRVDVRPFAREYYSRNRSGYEYKPGAQCPRFLDELMRPAIPDDDISLIQRYVGQCLIGDNPSQTLLILRGTPGGGKGTLTNIVESIIGRHNTTELRVQQLAERFELFRYLDKTLLCGKDVPGDFMNAKPAYVIKALVGGDQLSGEAKNGNDTFNVQGRFNIIITTNTRLRVRLDSDLGAWRRRLLIVDYDRPPTAKPIPNLDAELLRDEGAGILSWAVEGAIRLMAELRQYGKFQLTPAQQARIDDLLYESDSVQSFCRDQLCESPGVDISVSEITKAYHDYCDAKGWEPLRDRVFQLELPEAMLAQYRAIRRNDISRESKSVRGYMGIAFRGTDGKAVGGWE